MRRLSEFLWIRVFPPALAAILTLACILVSFSMCSAVRGYVCAQPIGMTHQTRFTSVFISHLLNRSS